MSGWASWVRMAAARPPPASRKRKAMTRQKVPTDLWSVPPSQAPYPAGASVADVSVMVMAGPELYRRSMDPDELIDGHDTEEQGHVRDRPSEEPHGPLGRRPPVQTNGVVGEHAAGNERGGQVDVAHVPDGIEDDGRHPQHERVQHDL